MNTHDSDIPPSFPLPEHPDCLRRQAMIPMRDGVKLYTELLIPKGTAAAPMMLDRTPYGAAKVTRLSSAPQALMQLYAFHADLLAAGFIVAVQDVRGKHKSEGRYEMNLPLRGELNPRDCDYATDAWDTIAWLIENVPESNGRVGTIGVSYDGYTALMSLIDPHPALKACVPINPMVDGWIGDDWFNNGAFRQQLTAPYAYTQTTTTQSERPFPAPNYDDYDTYLAAGSAGALGTEFGLDALPFWQRLCAHPAYDAYWESQAVDKILAQRPLSVPTLHVHSQWDAEDIYGAMAVFTALEQTPANRPNNHLVIGPWGHVGPCFHNGYKLGALSFASDTASHFRQHILLPFLNTHLRSDTAVPALPRLYVFQSGSNRWQTPDNWPGTQNTTPIYLAGAGELSFAPPQSTCGQDDYLSDPQRPVTHLPRPIRPKSAAGSGWEEWLVHDQRFASARPDVLTYAGPVLDEPMQFAGQPIVNLFAATTGSDADWIVKLIDLFPGQYPQDPALGGYQMPIAMGILRGRYRQSLTQATALEPGACLEYRFALPHVSHALQPGHRLMVQIQSSWFPLYDRNPQTFVDNVFFARPEDFQTARHSVYRHATAASRIELPLIS